MVGTNALTGLRFIAAALIVLHHSQTGYFLKQDALLPFILGGMVTLFFVLSGFVLAINAQKYRSFADFMVARIARVWPAHVAALVLLIVLLWPISNPWGADAPLLFAPSRLLLNVLLLHAWGTNPTIFWSFNAPSWSISVELFFYVSFFAVYAWMANWVWLRWLLLMALAALICFIVPILIPGVDPLWLGYINPIVNLPAFALGVGLGRQSLDRAPLRVGITAGTLIQVAALALSIAANGKALSLALMLPASLYNFVAVSSPVPAYGLLMVALVRCDGLLSRALSVKPMLVLGEASYALYLFHQIFIRYHAFTMGKLNSIPWWVQYAGLLSISLGTALLCHYLVERPSRRIILSAWRSAVGPGSITRKFISWVTSARAN